jgi:predicted nuclease of predicted toxin-antitoxin system
LKILIDMNLSPSWVRHLSEAGFEAVHWSMIGRSDAPDTVIMAHARNHGFIVLTNDLDFGAILAATGGDKPSVAEIRSDDLDPDVIGAHVTNALKVTANDLAEGALLTINPTRIRVTVLPLNWKG